MDAFRRATSVEGNDARKPAKSVTGRRSNDRRDFKRRFLFGSFRFPVFAAVGLAVEICRCNVVTVGRRIPGVSALIQLAWKVDPRRPMGGV